MYAGAMTRTSAIALALILASGACGGSDDPETPDAAPAIDSGFDIDGTAQPACVEPPSGIVAWWDGEVVGMDLTGTHNTTSGLGSPQTIEGHVGRSVAFGNSQFFVVDGAPTPATWTVEAWVQFRGTVDPYRSIYSRDNEAGVSLKNERITFWDESAAGDVVIGSTTLTEETYHHVAVTFDGFTLTVYANGVADGAAVASNLALPTVGSIGGHDDGLGGDGDNLLGEIDELTIYLRALADTEIAAIAAADTLGKCKE